MAGEKAIGTLEKNACALAYRDFKKTSRKSQNDLKTLDTEGAYRVGVIVAKEVVTLRDSPLVDDF